VQHEPLPFRDHFKVGELWLLRARINVSIPIVAEDAEGAIKVQVYGCWLHVAIIKGGDRNLA
jgi:hypothetical protein